MLLRQLAHLPSLPTTAMILAGTFSTRKLFSMTIKRCDHCLLLFWNFMHILELKWVMLKRGNKKMLTEADSALPRSKLVIKFG